MKCNVGKADQMFRFIVGAVVIVAGFAMHSWLGLIGLVMVITGFLRWCPAYTLFKFSTDKAA